MITKKDIPLELLKTIEPIAQVNKDIILFKREEGAYYSFYEIDEFSKNYFRILISGSGQRKPNELVRYAHRFKPLNATTTESAPEPFFSSVKELETRFKNWIALIRAIHNTPSVYDDPFTKQYADYYFEEFKIVDEDADKAPFNPAQQEIMEAHLLALSEAINSNSDIPEEAKKELQNEIQQAVIALPISTKNQVMKRVTWVIGKVFKISKGAAKTIVEETKRQLVKKLFELGIKYRQEIIDTVLSLGS